MNRVELEDKLILSMEIRLLLEEFIIKILKDEKGINVKVSKISGNQTTILISLYKENFEQSEIFEIMDKVNIMTPENIHLNSFMYEPILDLSITHLQELYKQVKDLTFEIEYKGIIEE